MGTRKSAPAVAVPDGVVRVADQPFAKHISALGLAYIDLGQAYLSSSGYKSGMIRRQQMPSQPPLLSRSASAGLLVDYRQAPTAPRPAASGVAEAEAGTGGGPDNASTGTGGPEGAEREGSAAMSACMAAATDGHSPARTTAVYQCNAARSTAPPLADAAPMAAEGRTRWTGRCEGGGVGV